MVPGFHGLDLVVILVVALLIFGPKKLPEMGSAIGKSIKEFKKGMNELTAPKEDKDEDAIRTPAKVDLEAIDREIASKKATASASEVPDMSEASSETSVE